MGIWPEEVSNEGHVYAALAKGCATAAVADLFEDHPAEWTTDAAEEPAPEDGP